MIEKKNINSEKQIYLIGISHWKSPVEIREKFSISISSYDQLIQTAKELEVPGIFIISTCNRTELYALTDDSNILRDLFIKFTKGSLIEFEKHYYVKSGMEALSHLFKVGCGMDSQILGDFEIIGQIRKSAKYSNKNGALGSEMTRLIDHLLKTTKEVKNKTELSNGAASTAHAAVQYLVNNVGNLSKKRILLYGLGKIGKNVCRNLLGISIKENISITNRTNSKAESVAKEFDINLAKHENLLEELSKADVIITATGAETPVIDKNILLKLGDFGPKTFIDLSVPRNVNLDILELNNTNLINIDYLVNIQNKALENRKASLPAAEEIIKESLSEFYEWLQFRKAAPTIAALKEKLNEIRKDEIKSVINKELPQEEKINYITNKIMNNITQMCIGHIKDNIKLNGTSVGNIQNIFDLEVD